MARDVPQRFFRESRPPNLKSQVVSPQFFFENHFPKSQIARGVPIRFFREASPQISNGKGCPPNILFRESSPQLLSRLLVLLYLDERRHPSIISLRFGLNYTCGVLRSFPSSALEKSLLHCGGTTLWRQHQATPLRPEYKSRKTIQMKIRGIATCGQAFLLQDRSEEPSIPVCINNMGNYNITKP